MKLWRSVKSDEVVLLQNKISIWTSSKEFIKYGFILNKHQNGYSDGSLECPLERFLIMEPQNGSISCHFITGVKYTYLIQKLVNYMDPTTMVFSGVIWSIFREAWRTSWAFQNCNTVCKIFEWKIYVLASTLSVRVTHFLICAYKACNNLR